MKQLMEIGPSMGLRPTFIYICVILTRDHPFSTFLPPDMYIYVRVSGGKKCYLFRNFAYALNE